MRSKKFLLLLFIAVLTVGFESCGSDDDNDEDNKANNEFVYGDTKAKAISCLALSTGHISQIVLIGEGVAFDKTKMEFSGQGYVFMIRSITQEKDLVGKYLVQKENEKPLDRILFQGMLPTITEVTNNPNGDLYYFLAGSELIINKEGDEYEVILQGSGSYYDSPIPENGVVKDIASTKVSAYYKGKIELINASN